MSFRVEKSSELDNLNVNDAFIGHLDASDLVDLSSAQTISGKKAFTGVPTFKTVSNSALQVLPTSGSFKTNVFSTNSAFDSNLSFPEISGTDELVSLNSEGTLSNKSILFPTVGGVAAELSYYEQYSFNTNAISPWNTSVQWSIDITRIGNVVNMRIGSADYGSNGSSGAVIQLNTVLPARFRPPNNTYLPFVAYYDVEQSHLMFLNILSSGVMIVSLVGGNPYNAFTAGKTANFYDNAVTFST